MTPHLTISDDAKTYHVTNIIYVDKDNNFPREVFIDIENSYVNDMLDNGAELTDIIQDIIYDDLAENYAEVESFNQIVR